MRISLTTREQRPAAAPSSGARLLSLLSFFKKGRLSMPIDPTTVLPQSVVRIFGWVAGQVTWQVPTPASKAGEKQILMGPHMEASKDADRLANILAFSHEGRYTPFRAPALFLVSSDGDPVWVGDKVDPARLGLAQLDQNVVFASNLRFWICDRSAYITRLDVSAGTLQRMVIDLETGGAPGRRVDLVGQESSFMARLGQGTY
jgi:hypothetical protein